MPEAGALLLDLPGDIVALQTRRIAECGLIRDARRGRIDGRRTSTTEILRDSRARNAPHIYPRAEKGSFEGGLAVDATEASHFADGEQAGNRAAFLI
jgi:hypothetical protein